MISLLLGSFTTSELEIHGGVQIGIILFEPYLLRSKPKPMNLFISIKFTVVASRSVT